jgi:HD-like signal output (HDOD) protein
VDTLSAQTIASPEEQVRRKNRLMAILEKGLPPFKHTVVQLVSILNDPSADLKKAAKPIYADPALSAQLLRMCNSPMFARRSRVISIEQAVGMLGTDRLRSLVMTSSIAGFAGQGLPKDQVASFWRHSFLAAMLSRYLAGYVGYSEIEQAYIAGLLHDIGQVPQWMLTGEEKAQLKQDLLAEWLDNPSVEHTHFGIDHCDLGSLMIQNWGFMPSFVDVALKHHDPSQAKHDPYLVQIVGGIEHFLLAKGEPLPVAAEGDTVTLVAEESALAAQPERSCQPFPAADWPAIEENLHLEYERILPVVEEGMATMLSSN